MDETEIDIRSILGVLRRQFRLILISVISIVLLAGLVAFSLTPMFTASTLILVDPSRKNLLDPQAQMSSSGSDSARIDSEVEILRADNILLRVIQAQDLLSDPTEGVSLSIRERVMAFLRLQEPERPSAAEVLNGALKKLRDAVSVQRKGLTNLISVQVRSARPENAANLANALAKAYIEDQLSSKVTSTLASRDVLQALIIQARQAITESEGSFDSFITSNIDRITADTGNTDIIRIQQQIEALKVARQNNARIAAAAEASLASNDIEAVVAQLQSSALAELDRQRTELANRLSGAQVGTAAAFDLQSALEAIDASLRTAAAEEVGALRQSLDASQTQETTLRQDLRNSVLDGKLSPSMLTELFEQQQNSELAKNQYQLLLSRSQDLEAQANLQVADSRIVSPALTPQSPSSPNRPLILALAGIAAVGLGVALAFLYENLIGGFTSEAQLSSVLKARVATAVPRQKKTSEKESVADLMVTAPLSVFSESIRRLRAALGLSFLPRRGERPARTEEGRVVMVCSTTPNEGKTTIALALGRSYALAGNRTLIIDCDLRKPSVHRHLGLEPSQGLLDFLRANETESLGSIILQDTLSSATVITGARRSDIATDQLLAGPAFERLIRAARTSFDIIVIDTPPIGAVIDSLYIAPHADVIAFVTRWSSTSQQEARQAFVSLDEAKRAETEIVALINQQDQSRGSYMRKYGDYYSDTGA